MLFYDILERLYRRGCRQRYLEIHVGPIDEFHAESDVFFWVVDIHVEIYSNVKGVLLLQYSNYRKSIGRAIPVSIVPLLYLDHMREE